MPKILKYDRYGLIQDIKEKLTLIRERKYKVQQRIGNDVYIGTELIEVEVKIQSLSILLVNIQKGISIGKALIESLSMAESLVKDWNRSKGYTVQLWEKFYQHELEMTCYRYIINKG